MATTTTDRKRATAALLTESTRFFCPTVELRLFDTLLVCPISYAVYRRKIHLFNSFLLFARLDWMNGFNAQVCLVLQTLCHDQLLVPSKYFNS